MYLNDWTFLWMAGNSWKPKCCLLLRLQSTHTQKFYWFAALCPPLCSLATSPYAKKVWMLRDSTASVLSRTGPSCGSALKWALADWSCYGFCRLESRNQQWEVNSCLWWYDFSVWSRTSPSGQLWDQCLLSVMASITRKYCCSLQTHLKHKKYDLSKRPSYLFHSTARV